MDMRIVEQSYDPTKDYISAVKISSEQLDEEDVSHICLVRHAQTELSRGIVQGQSLNPKIIIDRTAVSKLGNLEEFPWNALYSGNSIRASGTFESMIFYRRQKVYPSFLFNEQDLGKFEGRNRKEVIHDREFVRMSRDPNYKIEGVERGTDVLNRFLYGMSEIAKHDKFVGICTSYCAMNWIFKWATQDYKAATDIDHFDVMMFQYSPSENTYYFINQGPMNPAEALNAIEI